MLENTPHANSAMIAQAQQIILYASTFNSLVCAGEKLFHYTLAADMEDVPIMDSI